MLSGGFFTVTAALAIILAAIYAVVALLKGIKPSSGSILRVTASVTSIAAALRFIWLLTFGSDYAQLAAQDKFFLLIGVVAAGWYGIESVAKTFNKLFGVQLRSEEEAQRGGNGKE